MTGFVATVRTDVDASPQRVWKVLTDPAQIREFMFGAEVRTDWQPGSPITWTGEFQGRAYEDRGEIIAAELSGDDTTTHLSLSQDNNATEADAEHSRQMWTAHVDGIKAAAEQ
ncbi:SRPBCC domain-containing protein [Nocardia ignorata]|uniref:Uncharacterized protein YndB with AHSA1/START domain n=1 Tax=Nocardia ignorata TaxID=145285 RepID=A0A4R6NZ37_NOCIG|nr:SRPBCC domain-containing protein [Nocardia ignorata]TDP30624.1 uncharacterized protein YndB with AHSA1/START domain [Nocardia ignorata]